MPFVFRHNIIFIGIRKHYFHVNVFSDSVMIKVDIFMHMYVSAHCDVCAFGIIFMTCSISPVLLFIC